MNVLEACIRTPSAYTDTAIPRRPDQNFWRNPAFRYTEKLMNGKAAREKCAKANTRQFWARAFDPGWLCHLARFSPWTIQLDDVKSIDIVRHYARQSWQSNFSTTRTPRFTFAKFYLEFSPATVYSLAGRAAWARDKKCSSRTRWDLPVPSENKATCLATDEVQIRLRCEYPQAAVRF